MELIETQEGPGAAAAVCSGPTSFKCMIPTSSEASIHSLDQPNSFSSLRVLRIICLALFRLVKESTGYGSSLAFSDAFPLYPARLEHHISTTLIYGHCRYQQPSSFLAFPLQLHVFTFVQHTVWHSRENAQTAAIKNASNSVSKNLSVSPASHYPSFYLASLLQ